jgi:hypothetical protein
MDLLRSDRSEWYFHLNTQLNWSLLAIPNHTKAYERWHQVSMQWDSVHLSCSYFKAWIARNWIMYLVTFMHWDDGARVGWAFELLALPRLSYGSQIYTNWTLLTVREPSDTNSRVDWGWWDSHFGGKTRFVIVSKPKLWATLFVLFLTLSLIYWR